MQTNPLVQQAAGVTALIVVVKAFISYFRAMGWWDLDEQQYQETVSFIETVVPILAVWGAAFWTMRKVTPLSNPKDIDGELLTRPDNSPAIPKLSRLQKEATKINDTLDDRRIKR